MKCNNCTLKLALKYNGCDKQEYYYDYDPKFCPECGTKIEKEPELPWWCVGDMTVKNNKGNIFTIASIGKLVELAYYEQSWYCEKHIITKDFIPCGGPFDMIPTEAKGIIFNHNGAASLQCVYNNGKDRDLLDFPIWHNCPEEFKGKKYPIDWRTK